MFSSKIVASVPWTEEKTSAGKLNRHWSGGWGCGGLEIHSKIPGGDVDAGRAPLHSHSAQRLKAVGLKGGGLVKRMHFSTVMRVPEPESRPVMKTLAV